MRRSSLIVCALLVTASSGCERVKKQVASVGATVSTTVKQQVDALRQRFLKKRAPSAPAQPAPVAATPAPTPPPPPPPPPAPVQTASARPRPMRDVPFVSQDTGTLSPGMGEKDVYALWGPPAAVRRIGEFTYIYFQNGCEYSCGHLDVVTLQNGQVVDAILRWPGHGYAGQSTSPEGTQPHARPGGDTLRIAPPPAVNESPDTTSASPQTP